MLRKILKGVGALTLLIALAIGGLRLWYEVDEPGLASFLGFNKTDGLVGQVAPEFALPKVGGGEMSLSALRGKPVLVFFWATWCPSCDEMIPVVARLREQVPDLTVVAVTFREDATLSADEIDARIGEKLGSHDFIAVRGGDEVAEAFRLRAIPNIVVVDAEGVVHYTGIGAHTLETLREILTAAG